MSFDVVHKVENPHHNEVLDFLSVNNYTDEFTDPSTVVQPGTLTRGASSPLLSRYGSTAAILMDFSKSGDGFVKGHAAQRSPLRQHIPEYTNPQRIPNKGSNDHHELHNPSANPFQSTNAVLIQNKESPSRLVFEGFLNADDTPTSTVYCAGTPRPFYAGGPENDREDRIYHTPLNFGSGSEVYHHYDAEVHHQQYYENDEEIVVGDGFDDEESLKETSEQINILGAHLPAAAHQHRADVHMRNDKYNTSPEASLDFQQGDLSEEELLYQLNDMLETLDSNASPHFGSYVSSRSGTPSPNLGDTHESPLSTQQLLFHLINRYRNRSAEVERLRELLAFTVQKKKDEAEALLREKSISASATGTSMVEAAINDTMTGGAIHHTSSFHQSDDYRQVADPYASHSGFHASQNVSTTHQQNVSSILEHHRMASRSRSPAMSVSRVGQTSLQTSRVGSRKSGNVTYYLEPQELKSSRTAPNVFSPYRSIHDLISPIKAQDSPIPVSRPYQDNSRHHISGSQLTGLQQDKTRELTEGNNHSRRCSNTQVVNDVTARAIKNFAAAQPNTSSTRVVPRPSISGASNKVGSRVSGGGVTTAPIEGVVSTMTSAIVVKSPTLGEGVTVVEVRGTLFAS